MSFADKLQEVIATMPFRPTQEELARQSGIPIGTIRNYWQGIREPSWANVQRIARALNVSCDRLRTDDNPAPNT